MTDFSRVPVSFSSSDSFEPDCFLDHLRPSPSRCQQLSSTAGRLPNFLADPSGDELALQRRARVAEATPGMTAKQRGKG